MSSVFSRPGDATQPDAPQQYLTFTLADEVFAVGTRSVREIIEYARLTPVPMMPPCVLGVINLRGGVVPIMDLRQRLGAGHTAISRRSCVVILEVERDDLRQVMGVLVEAVNAVIEIAAQDIEPPPLRRPHPHRLHPRHGQARRPLGGAAGHRPGAVPGRSAAPGRGRRSRPATVGLNRSPP